MPISLLLLIAVLSPTVFALFQYPDCNGTPNNLTLIDVEPQLVSSVANGSKYIIQNPQNQTILTILALRGSWYDIGYAYGQLAKEELADVIPGMFNYIVNQTDNWWDDIEPNLPFFQKWIPNLLNMTNQDRFTALLNLQYQLTSIYTPQRYADQYNGMADGAGIDQSLLIGVNMFPELIRAACSMAGIWDTASADGKLIQLRALDWDPNTYAARYPFAVVYFPDEEESNPFATFGFAGLVGAISGYSTKVAISEKVWLPQTTDPRSEFGEPFMYVLRDILQFGNDLESSMGLIYEAKRTCKIHVGVGSKADNRFEGLEIDYNSIAIFNDVNYTNYTTAHPQMNGVMFWDKHVQPSANMCLGSILQSNLGHIDAEFMFRQAVPLHQTGDTQVVVYQFENDTVYYASSDPVAQLKAYERPFLKLNMGELLTYEKMFN